MGGIAHAISSALKGISKTVKNGPALTHFVTELWIKQLLQARGTPRYEDVAWFAAINVKDYQGALETTNKELAKNGLPPLVKITGVGWYKPTPTGKLRYYDGKSLLVSSFQ